RPFVARILIQRRQPSLVSSSRHACSKCSRCSLRFRSRSSGITSCLRLEPLLVLLGYVAILADLLLRGPRPVRDQIPPSLQVRDLRKWGGSSRRPLALWKRVSRLRYTESSPR